MRRQAADNIDKNRGRRIFPAVLMILLSAPLYGVSYVHLNDADRIVVSSLPTELVLTCDAASIGNKLICEMFHDVDNDGRISADDPRTFYHLFADGVGTLRDESSKRDAVAGDDTPADGRIRAVLSFDASWNPGCPQNWLLRITDSDGSVASAVVSWRLGEKNSGLCGRVNEEGSQKPLGGMLITFISDELSERIYRAITNPQGEYKIDLKPGQYTVYLKGTRQHKEAQRRARVVADEHRRIDFAAEQWPARVTGRVLLNEQPVAGVCVVLQGNTDDQVYFGITDDEGRYCIGAEAGEYRLRLDPEDSRQFGGGIWPQGCFVAQEEIRIVLGRGAAVEKDFVYLPYPAVITGRCLLENKPVADASIQAVGIDPQNGRRRVYRCFSDKDGRFMLGVDQVKLLTLYAQKQGLFSTVISDAEMLDIRNRSFQSEVHLTFDRASSLMSISGRVIDEKGRPLADVPVVARHADASSPEGHLITHTNAEGNYFFDIVKEGDWRIGAIALGRTISPQLSFKFLTSGVRYENVDFVVGGGLPMLANGSTLHIYKLGLLPRLPDDFSKSLLTGFVFPQSGYAEIPLTTPDAERLAELIDEQLSRGYRPISWDGEEKQGTAIADGIRLHRITSEPTQAVNKTQ